jgi:hypothetical protein
MAKIYISIELLLIFTISSGRILMAIINNVSFYNYISIENIMS